MPGSPGSNSGGNPKGETTGWPGLWASVSIHRGFSAWEQGTTMRVHIPASSPMNEALRPSGRECAYPQGPNGHQETHLGHSAHTDCTCAHQVLEQNAGARLWLPRLA